MVASARLQIKAQAHRALSIALPLSTMGDLFGDELTKNTYEAGMDDVLIILEDIVHLATEEPSKKD